MRPKGSKNIPGGGRLTVIPKTSYEILKTVASSSGKTVNQLITDYAKKLKRSNPHLFELKDNLKV